MNTEEQAILDLVTRVTEWEEIPLQTRRDFLAHLIEINTLDDKALEFIAQTLNRFADQENARLLELKQELANYQAYIAAQAKPETSWKQRIYESANAQVQSISDRFKTGFRGAESHWMKTEESNESQAEKSEVEALKAGLMA